jgi:hypothetical protein
LSDAVEIKLLIGLMQEQNSGGVNERLNQAGAVRAAVVLRNALTARLVTLIARAYAEPLQGDLLLRLAVDLLKDKVTREVFESGDGTKKLAAFDELSGKCRGDHRLSPIKEFRDKYTAHLWRAQTA